MDLRLDEPPEHLVRVERVIAAPVGLVWGVLSDSNRWNRFVGVSPTMYHYRTLDSGRRVREGEAHYRGHPMVWIEQGEWLERHYFWGERTFSKALIDRAGLRIRLEPAPEGTRVIAEAYTSGEGWVARVVQLYWRRVYRRLLPRYLDAAAELLTGVELPPGPSSSAARLALVGVERSELGDDVSPADDTLLTRGLTRLRDAGVTSDLVERIRDHLVARPDDAVRDIRPLELARAWGADPRRTLGAWLHATRAGLATMSWQIDCPVCRVQADRATSLRELERQVHCEECNIRFDVDFDANVELVFSVDPALRDVPERTYCGGTPWVRPHVFAQLHVSAAGERRLEAQLPTSPLLVRAAGFGQRHVADIAAAEGLEVVVTEAGLEAAAGTPGMIRVVNQTGHAMEVHVERAGWEAPVARGRLLATLPEFHDLFSTEAPALGLQLRVGRLALLFTDLVGSTRMYTERGDAAAFALVQRHFALVRTAIEAHRGAVVKTMGDAVMASFEQADDAVRAAQAMHLAVAELGLGLRVGVHEGPCLAVQANDRFDVFGSTVNIAARLEALAGPGETALLEDLRAEVAPDAIAEVVDAEFPGLDGLYRCARLRGAG